MRETESLCQKYWFQKYGPKLQGRTDFLRGANNARQTSSDWCVFFTVMDLYEAPFELVAIPKTLQHQPVFINLGTIHS